MSEAIVEYDENLSWMGQKYKQELIRCKDCKRYKNHDKRCVVWNHGVTIDDFCSRAERREP